MNKIVAVAAAASVPLASASIANADIKTNAPLLRAEEMVKALREGYWWSDSELDEQAAEVMLNYLRSRDMWADDSHLTNDELDQDHRKFVADVLPFFDRYNQSLDWVVRGDPSVMICSRAALSEEAAKAVDPIFAALDTFRCAEVEFYADHGGDIPDDIGGRWSQAADVVINTQPTTPAGLGALTSFARNMAERSNRGDAGLADWQRISVMAAIDDAARGMSGLKAWSPPGVAGEDHRDDDPTFAAITKFRSAKKKSRAAYARVSRLYREAAKHGLGDESLLKDRNDFIEARLGCHPDEFTDGPAAAYWDAADDVFSTVPTTKAGLVALLRFAADMNDNKDHDLVEENMKNFVSSLNAAAVALLST